MNDLYTQIVIAVVMVVLMCALHLYTEAKVKQMQRELDAMDKRLSDHWRTHKDDCYALTHKHDKLVEALGFVEAPPSGRRYVKKGNV